MFKVSFGVEKVVDQEIVAHTESSFLVESLEEIDTDTLREQIVSMGRSLDAQGQGPTGDSEEALD